MKIHLQKIDSKKLSEKFNQRRKKMKGKQKKPNMEFPKMEVAVTKQKKQKGITLIALVVTIVVMLILAGITIQTTLGDGSKNNPYALGI